jgi:sortase A
MSEPESSSAVQRTAAEHPDRARRGPVTGLLLRAAGHALLAVSLVCGGTYTLVHLRAEILTRLDRLEQGRLDSALAGEGLGASALSPAAAGRARPQARPGRVWGRFEVPRLGLTTPVAEGVDDGTLGLAIGHFPGTAFPGEAGNVALAGHRNTILRVLEEVWPEDVVRLTTQDGVFEYRVEWLAIVDPGRTDVVASTDEPLLTLVTGYPFEHVGKAPLRYVLRARSIDRPTPGV